MAKAELTEFQLLEAALVETFREERLLISLLSFQDFKSAKTFEVGLAFAHGSFVHPVHKPKMEQAARVCVAAQLSPSTVLE